jgi:hypothetical protein
MPLVIRLDPELEVGLEELAREQGVSKAEVLRSLLRERLERRKKRVNAYAIASELGLIGMDDDPRTDVAQHHSKYLRTALRGKRPA